MSSMAYYERIGKRLSLKLMRDLFKLRDDFEGAESPKEFALQFVQNPFYHSFGWGTVDDDFRARLVNAGFSNAESYEKDPDRFFALAHELLKQEKKVARSEDSPKSDRMERVYEYRAMLGMLARTTVNLTHTQEKLNSHAQENHSALNRSFRGYSHASKPITEYTDWLVNESYRLRDEYYLSPRLIIAKSYVQLMTDWYEFARAESKLFDFDRLEACYLMLSDLEVDLLLQSV